MRELRDVKFDVLRNALYHQARRNWLEMLGRLLNLIVILSGAAAVSDIFKSSINLQWFAFAATVAGTFQLVFDFGGRAKSHEFLQIRYFELMADIERTLVASEEQICQWDAELTRIYAGEPPIMRALDAIAYNNAADALNMPNRCVVPWWRGCLRHVSPFNNWSVSWVRAPETPTD